MVINLEVLSANAQTEPTILFRVLELGGLAVKIHFAGCDQRIAVSIIVGLVADNLKLAHLVSSKIFSTISRSD